MYPTGRCSRHWLLAAAVAAVLCHSRSRSGGPGSGEWRYYSGDNGSTKYSPLDQINKRQRRRAEDRLAAARRSIASLLRPSRRCALQQLPLDADHGRRRPLRVERRRPRRSVRSGNRQDVWVQKPGAGRADRSRQRAIAASRTGARAPTRASSRSAIAISTRSIRRPASRSPTFGNERRRRSRRRRRSAQHAAIAGTRVPLDRARRDRHGLGDGRAGFGDEDRRAIPATCAPTTCAPASCAGPSTSSRRPDERRRSRPGTAIRGNTPAPATSGR